MKGKGKTPQQDSKDCPLQFPDLTPIDHTKECHKFTQGYAFFESREIL